MMEQHLNSTETVSVKRSLLIFFRQLSPKRVKLSNPSPVPISKFIGSLNYTPDLGRSELGYEEEHHSKSSTKATWEME